MIQPGSAITHIMQGKTGHTVDINGESGEQFSGVSLAHYLLFEDEVFEDIAIAPKPLALINYLLGRSAVLSSMTCHFKGPGGTCLPLHSDNGNGMPAPYSMISQVANVNYALAMGPDGAGSDKEGAQKRIGRRGHPVGPQDPTIDVQ